MESIWDQVFQRLSVDSKEAECLCGTPDNARIIREKHTELLFEKKGIDPFSWEKVQHGVATPMQEEQDLFWILEEDPHLCVQLRRDTFFQKVSFETI